MNLQEPPAHATQPCAPIACKGCGAKLESRPLGQDGHDQRFFDVTTTVYYTVNSSNIVNTIRRWSSSTGDWITFTRDDAQSPQSGSYGSVYKFVRKDPQNGNAILASYAVKVVRSHKQEFTIPEDVVYNLIQSRGKNCCTVRMKQCLPLDPVSHEKSPADVEKIMHVYLMDMMVPLKTHIKENVVEMSVAETKLDHICTILDRVQAQMQCLYEHGTFVYTDLKMDNVLCRGQGDNISIHLGDLGSALVDREGTHVFTYPPPACDAKMQCIPSDKIAVYRNWGLGALCVELIETAFEFDNDKQLSRLLYWKTQEKDATSIQTFHTHVSHLYNKQPTDPATRLLFVCARTLLNNGTHAKFPDHVWWNEHTMYNKDETQPISAVMKHIWNSWLPNVRNDVQSTPTQQVPLVAPPRTLERGESPLPSFIDLTPSSPLRSRSGRPSERPSDPFYLEEFFCTSK